MMRESSEMDANADDDANAEPTADLCTVIRTDEKDAVHHVLAMKDIWTLV